jgi:hypothetical protein
MARFHSPIQEHSTGDALLHQTPHGFPPRLRVGGAALKALQVLLLERLAVKSVDIPEAHSCLASDEMFSSTRLIWGLMLEQSKTFVGEFSVTKARSAQGQ